MRGQLDGRVEAPSIGRANPANPNASILEPIPDGLDVGSSGVYYCEIGESEIDGNDFTSASLESGREICWACRYDRQKIADQYRRWA